MNYAMAVFPSVELATLLLEKGANPEAANTADGGDADWATTPLQAAKDHPELVALVKKHGATK